MYPKGLVLRVEGLGVRVKRCRSFPLYPSGLYPWVWISKPWHIAPNVQTKILDLNSDSPTKIKPDISHKKDCKKDRFKGRIKKRTHDSSSALL